MLDELVTLGLLSRVEVGDGVARYEPQRPTTSMSTTTTSSATAAAASSPFQDDALERAIRGLAARVAFDVSDHDVTLHGNCETLPEYLDERLGTSTPHALPRATHEW